MPWPKYSGLKNVQKVAKWWCGGDCEKAKRLPPSLFAEILFCALVEEEGKEIADENAEKEADRRARATAPE